MKQKRCLLRFSTFGEKTEDFKAKKVSEISDIGLLCSSMHENPNNLTSMVMRMTIIHSNLKLCFSLRWLLIRSVSCVQCSSFSFTTWTQKGMLGVFLLAYRAKQLSCCCCCLTYINSAVDAEELAGLVVQLFQIFPVPVEIWCHEEVRPQVYTVSAKTKVWPAFVPEVCIYSSKTSEKRFKKYKSAGSSEHIFTLMWRAHQSSSSPRRRTTSLSYQTSVSAGEKKTFVNSINGSIADIDRADDFVSLQCDLFAVPLELFELIRQSCPTEPPIWRASLKTKGQSSEHVLSTKQNKTCEHNLLPDKHNALENANFSRTDSCSSIWSLRIKFPRSSLVFPLREREFSNLTQVCALPGVSNKTWTGVRWHTLLQCN